MMDGSKPNRLSVGLLFAPLLLVCHFVEESPDFVDWFNSHVARGITQESFWMVNVTGLVITLAVVAVEWVSRSTGSLLLASAWLGFLMFANALFHIIAGVVDRRYVPGLVTASVLYLPYFVWFTVAAVRSRRAPAGWIFTCAAVGALPMFVHGYLILFRGSRLF